MDSTGWIRLSRRLLAIKAVCECVCAVVCDRMFDTMSYPEYCYWLMSFCTLDLTIVVHQVPRLFLSSATNMARSGPPYLIGGSLIGHVTRR